MFADFESSQNLSYPQFLFVLTAPFVAKLIVEVGSALGFIYEAQWSTIRWLSLLVGLALVVITIAFAIRYLFNHAWIGAVASCVAVFAALALPSIDFHPEYLVFKGKKQRYLEAISADPSPPPKFKFFQTAFPPAELFIM